MCHTSVTRILSHDDDDGDDDGHDDDDMVPVHARHDYLFCFYAAPFTPGAAALNIGSRPIQKYAATTPCSRVGPRVRSYITTRCPPAKTATRRRLVRIPLRVGSGSLPGSPGGTHAATLHALYFRAYGNNEEPDGGNRLRSSCHRLPQIQTYLMLITIPKDHLHSWSLSAAICCFTRSLAASILAWITCFDTCMLP